MYEKELSSRAYVISGSMAVSRKDTVEVIEDAVRGYIVNYLSAELDPTVETELVGFRIYEVREVMTLLPGPLPMFHSQKIRTRKHTIRRSRRWRTSTSTVAN